MSDFRVTIPALERLESSFVLLAGEADVIRVGLALDAEIDGAVRASAAVLGVVFRRSMS